MLKKSCLRFLAALSFLIFNFTASATTYYVSSSGNDSNSGTDPSSPWQTINKVNSFNKFAAGDNILFRRGDTFYGGITASNAGRSGNPISYGAYGSGSKPVITGFTSVTSWINKGGNIWESSNAVSSLPALKMVVINGVNTPVGRYPNASTTYPFLPNFFPFQSHTGTGSGNTSITSSNLSGGANWTGAEVVVRTNSWTFDKQTITSQSGSTLRYTGESDGMSDGWGFFIQSDIKTLDVQNEWYYNPSTKKISIYSIGTPANVQASTVEMLFYLNSNSPASNSTNVDNISFTGANTNAIWISGNLTFSVTNCDVSYSGLEGMLLYGGGIQNATINNNTFSNCGSSGIFTTGTVNSLTIKNNTVSGAGMISTYKPDDYTNGGINISAPNSIVQYNTVENSAYNGIAFSGANVQIRNNFINYSNMVRDDGGGIYTGYKEQPGKVIDGNIVLNSIGNTNGGPSDKELASYGIFIDDFGNNMSITNNTIANCTGAGINLHDTKNITANNNTAYNNGLPGGWGNGNLFVQADAGGFTSYVRGNRVTNNIFFAKTIDQHALRYYADPNGDNNVTSFGTIDYNYYAKPLSATTAMTSEQNIGKGNMSLSQWQSMSGQDANSKESPKAITDVNDLRFEYNATNQSKTIALDANYIDVKGNNYNGSITLAAYSSAVLIKNGASTNPLLPAVNPSNTVNGIDFKYYEGGSYNNVVSESAREAPIKTGTLNNFDLSIASRTDAFAINFSGYINVPADGQYTFYTSSDDGSVLSIDGVKVVDNDGVHGAREVSGIIGLKAGMHAISVNFFQQSGDKVLKVSYTGPGISTQVIPSSALYRVSTDVLSPAVNPSNTVNGIDYKYYEAGSYAVLPDFSNSSPIKTGALNNFDLSIANRAEAFAVNFTGYIDVPTDGQYTFYTSSDDGSNLYIDGVKVVDNDGQHSAREISGTIGLKAGKHAISVGFFQQLGDKTLQVSYSGPGVSKQAIPSSALYRVSSGGGGNLLPAVNPSNTVNGIDYKYYEASSYSTLPDFSSASPVKTGNLNNFDLSIANRAEVFAVNFTGYIDVPTDGQYTFYTSSDDGSNLYIDGVKVVDNDGQHSAREISGTIGLKAGKHAISVGFFQQLGDKTLQVSYAGPGVSKQAIPSSALYRVSSGGGGNLLPAVNPSNTVNGIDYKYYEASSYSALPDFSSASPIKTGNLANFDLSIANRAEVFAVNFTGYIDVPTDGQYTFYTSSDDGSNLYIDGIKVVDNDGLHSAQEISGTIGLKAGKHAISVGFFQQLGDKTLQVSYSGPGVSKQAIPSSALYRVSTDNNNLLPAVNPSNTVNGIDYKYYEASSYSSLPNFSSASPVKTGNLANFDLSIANRVNAFAVNFTGYIDVPADGQYTFYTLSDDGSNLYIDGMQFVANDGIHSAVQQSNTVGLKAGKHAISVDYFQQSGDKVLQVSYSGPGIAKQVIPSSILYRVSNDDGLLPSVNPSNTTNGLNYKYFEGSYFNAIPDFSKISPVKTGTIGNFDLSVADRTETFAMNFSGYIDVPADGQYTFYTLSDDGSNLYIDGMQFVANDGIHSAVQQSNTVGLKAGKHAISVDYFQQSGDKVLQVSYSGPGLAKQLIPSSALYRVSSQSRMAFMGTNASGADSTATGVNGNANAVTNTFENTQLKVGVTAYPNPFTNSIVVSITGGAGAYHLLLVDVLGRTIWTRNGTKSTGTYQQSINTSSLQRGVYFLKVIQNNKTEVIKLKK